MFEKIKELLPIGSIVALEGAERRLMVTGYFQTEEGDENDEKIFDYVGIFYPEGVMMPDMNVLFNQEDIAHVDFKGFNDYERQQFIKNVLSMEE